MEADKLGTDGLSVKERVVRDDLKRLLVQLQLAKHALEAVRTSETLREWAEIAKAKKNKSFVDFTILAANELNNINVMMFRMKKSMLPVTWNAIMNTLTSEQVKEIDLLLNEITELREDAIERITVQVKEAKVRAGIPLNNPDEIIELKTESHE